MSLVTALLASWLCHNGLALNNNKSETILLGTSARLRNFPPVLHDINISGNLISLFHKIVDLGATLDAQVAVALTDHTSNVCLGCIMHTSVFVCVGVRVSQIVTTPHRDLQSCIMHKPTNEPRSHTKTIVKVT